jgi:hypothetical protein
MADNQKPWMVVIKIETKPVEVYCFSDELEAVVFFERVRMNWSDVYLTKVIKGPLV